MTAEVLKLREAVPETPPALKRIRTKLTYQRERFADVCMELGPLMNMHDAEIWPHRTWGPKGKVKFNLIKYLALENQGILKVITVRTKAGRPVGYCLEALELDDHYGIRGAINCGIFIRKEYRAGKGLSLRSQPGYRLLRERERLLDEVKAERRRIGVKVWMDFGGILRRLGYRPDMIQYQLIVPPEDD